jgi:hypothetical protein
VVHGGRGVDLGIGGTRRDGVGKKRVIWVRTLAVAPVVVRAPALFLSPLLSSSGEFFFFPLSLSLAFIFFYSSSRLPRQVSFIRLPSIFVLLLEEKRISF